MTPPDEGFARISTLVSLTKGDAAVNPQRKNHLITRRGNPEPDILVHNEGTFLLFNPLTSRAKEWIDNNVQDDAQWFGTTLIVEHRYAWGLAQGMKDDGLVLQ